MWDCAYAGALRCRTMPRLRGAALGLLLQVPRLTSVVPPPAMGRRCARTARLSRESVCVVSTHVSCARRLPRSNRAHRQQLLPYLTTARTCRREHAAALHDRVRGARDIGRARRAPTRACQPSARRVGTRRDRIRVPHLYPRVSRVLAGRKRVCGGRGSHSIRVGARC